MTSKMDVYIDALLGRDEPIGAVFLSYSQADSQEVKNTLESNLDSAGIPYFRDEKDIQGGQKTTPEIERAVSFTRCGIVVLSPRSITSPWVWFETGIMVGVGKDIFPFLLNYGNKDQFIRDLPQFITQYKLFTDVGRLIESVKTKIFEFGMFVEDAALNKKLLAQLRRVRIEFAIELPANLRAVTRFGCLLVRFGKDDVTDRTKSALRKLRPLNRPIVAKHTGDYETGRKVKIEIVLPVHAIEGTTYKPYVDVLNPSYLPEVMKHLTRAGAKDVQISHSAEKQRIYFLLPLPKKNIVTEQAGIKNNYMFPV